MPIGVLSVANPIGTESAGKPVRLTGRVTLVMSPDQPSVRAPVGALPSSDASVRLVGVRMTSTLSKASWNSRVTTCRTCCETMRSSADVRPAAAILW